MVRFMFWLTACIIVVAASSLTAESFVRRATLKSGSTFSSTLASVRLVILLLPVIWLTSAITAGVIFLGDLR